MTDSSRREILLGGCGAAVAAAMPAVMSVVGMQSSMKP
jgi:hypothetical protein